MILFIHKFGNESKCCSSVIIISMSYYSKHGIIAAYCADKVNCYKVKGMNGRMKGSSMFIVIDHFKPI